MRRRRGGECFLHTQFLGRKSCEKALLRRSTSRRAPPIADVAAGAFVDLGVELSGSAGKALSKVAARKWRGLVRGVTGQGDDAIGLLDEGVDAERMLKVPTKGLVFLQQFDRTYSVKRRTMAAGLLLEHAFELGPQYDIFFAPAHAHQLRRSLTAVLKGARQRLAREESPLTEPLPEGEPGGVYSWATIVEALRRFAILPAAEDDLVAEALEHQELFREAERVASLTEAAREPWNDDAEAFAESVRRMQSKRNGAKPQAEMLRLLPSDRANVFSPAPSDGAEGLGRTHPGDLRDAVKNFERECRNPARGNDADGANLAGLPPESVCSRAPISQLYRVANAVVWANNGLAADREFSAASPPPVEPGGGVGRGIEKLFSKMGEKVARVTETRESQVEKKVDTDARRASRGGEDGKAAKYPNSEKPTFRSSFFAGLEGRLRTYLDDGVPEHQPEHPPDEMALGAGEEDACLLWKPVPRPAAARPRSHHFNTSPEGGKPVDGADGASFSLGTAEQILARGAVMRIAAFLWGVWHRATADRAADNTRRRQQLAAESQNGDVAGDDRAGDVQAGGADSDDGFAAGLSEDEQAAAAAFEKAHEMRFALEPERFVLGQMWCLLGQFLVREDFSAAEDGVVDTGSSSNGNGGPGSSQVQMVSTPRQAFLQTGSDVSAASLAPVAPLPQSRSGAPGAPPLHASGGTPFARVHRGSALARFARGVGRRPAAARAGLSSSMLQRLGRSASHGFGSEEPKPRARARNIVQAVAHVGVFLAARQLMRLLADPGAFDGPAHVDAQEQKEVGQFRGLLAMLDAVHSDLKELALFNTTNLETENALSFSLRNEIASACGYLFLETLQGEDEASKGEGEAYRSSAIDAFLVAQQYRLLHRAWPRKSPEAFLADVVEGKATEMATRVAEISTAAGIFNAGCFKENFTKWLDSEIVKP